MRGPADAASKREQVERRIAWQPQAARQHCQGKVDIRWSAGRGNGGSFQRPQRLVGVVDGRQKRRGPGIALGIELMAEARQWPVMDIVKLAINNARLTISVLVFLLIAGWVAYQSTPKEAEPDVPIPMMYVSLIYQGISPEDSERLLLRPMESKLKSLKGLKEMRSAAFQGGGYVLVEFQPQTNLATALQDTRSKVQDGKADLPQAAEEPVVTEVNISEFPVLVVTLSGELPERVLAAAARELRDRIEEVPGVLEGSLQGSRDDLVEVVIDPMKLSSYGLQLDQLIGAVGASNSLVAAGNIEGSEGKYAVKVPSLIETPEDVAALPVVAGPNAVVQAKDIATIRSTFADATTITRLNGKPAIAIEVKKRIGANLIDTLTKVRAVSDGFVKTMPEGMHVTYTQDKSVFVNQLLGDLQNHGRRQAGGALPHHRAGAHRRAAGRHLRRLFEIWRRRRVLPERGAGLRPALCACRRRSRATGPCRGRRPRRSPPRGTSSTGSCGRSRRDSSGRCSARRCVL